jgi:hypothetical protein
MSAFHRTPKNAPVHGSNQLGLWLTTAALFCCVAVSASAQSNDALLDFSPVAPPQGDKIKLPQPWVSWLVRPDAAQYCEQVKEQDGFAVWQEGCVYWSKAKPSCTIVTTAKTTHSQMGRLFLYCMDAGEPS